LALLAAMLVVLVSSMFVFRFENVLAQNHSRIFVDVLLSLFLIASQ